MTKTGVNLRDGKSASVILYEVGKAAIDEFSIPESDIHWPRSLQAFRKTYIDALPEFEAYRLGHARRTEIATSMAKRILEYLVWGEDESLSEALKQDFAALPLVTVIGDQEGHWQPRFEYGGQEWHDFAQLGMRLGDECVISQEAVQSLAWAQEECLSEGGIDLTGRKVVVLGAAAEMASTREFLAAGAEVLWIDRIAPPESLIQTAAFPGTLHYVEAGSDLLWQTGEILATIIEFSGGDAVDLCLYAYAPGQAREIRLTGVMCALVNALSVEVIRSVTVLVSPTTPSGLDASDLKLIETRLSQRPGWESALDAVGLLGKGGGFVRVGEHATIRSLVSIQGASYQAAQYLCKLIMAEAWSNHGLIGADTGPIRVSANTAAITQTRSLDHPVFDAAFGGAEAMQVQTFTPVQSQCLNAILAIVDWLKPEMPIPGAVRIHGGIHVLPYPLESALKPAAGIGFARSPGLLLGLLVGRKS